MAVLSFKKTIERIEESRAPLLVTAVYGLNGSLRFNSYPTGTVFSRDKMNSESRDIIGVFEGLQGAEKFKTVSKKFM